jgi:hypothetical protein
MASGHKSPDISNFEIRISKFCYRPFGRPLIGFRVLGLPFENLRAVCLVERSNHDRRGLLIGSYLANHRSFELDGDFATD